ncbi:MAG TPA: hypothetical protein VK762_22725 [Polyangiaceae bacterium]|jgi:hypothetical protein|nr:hypothetical protein [Polyangiaceae bacterium]
MTIYVANTTLRLCWSGAVVSLVLGFAGCGSSSTSTPYAGGAGSSGGSHESASSGGSSGGSSSSGVGSSSGSSSGGTETESSSGGGDAAAGTPSSRDGGGDDSTTATESGAPAMSHPDLGKGDGSDVILLGDSWMSNTLQIEGTGGGIAPALQQVSMQPYRNYAVQGVMMLMADSFGPAIPTQYPQAKAANPDIKTVVMTGGGNDIIQNSTLQADCQMGGAMCKMTLDEIGDALNTLWTQMATDGVQDIVYVNYSADVGTVAPSLRGDGGVPTPAICMTGKVRCWEYDSTEAVMKQIAADGIHPLAAANTRMATEIYALMTNEGMRR